MRSNMRIYEDMWIYYMRVRPNYYMRVRPNQVLSLAPHMTSWAPKVIPEQIAESNSWSLLGVTPKTKWKLLWKYYLSHRFCLFEVHTWKCSGLSSDYVQESILVLLYGSYIVPALNLDELHARQPTPHCVLPLFMAPPT